MIIRTSLTCETCAQPHTVRIGMGHEEYHAYTFPCRSCSEPIVVGLRVDFKKIAHRVEYEKNAIEAREVPGAPIVNVDANFLVSDEEQGQDLTFPRLKQLHAMLQDAEAQGRLVPFSDIPPSLVNARPYRRPDYAAEWQLLKKAWSLHRNDHAKLSMRRIVEATKLLYPHEPLKDLPDWLWRFALHLCQPSFESRFSDAVRVINTITDRSRLKDLWQYYGREMSPARAKRYLNLFSEYFSGFSDFSQVHFLVATGVDIPKELHASSANFEQTKMFYGNAFETLGSIADILAYLNNILSGRAFDQFQSLSMADYAKLDKASRFGPFAMNPAFSSLCAEADNQLRNASHHGAMEYDAKSGSIKFRVGKGGLGAEQEIDYATYMSRCTNIFLAIVSILRIELVFCNRLGVRYPL